MTNFFNLLLDTKNSSKSLSKRENGQEDNGTSSASSASSASDSSASEEDEPYLS